MSLSVVYYDIVIVSGAPLWLKLLSNGVIY